MRSLYRFFPSTFTYDAIIKLYLTNGCLEIFLFPSPENRARLLHHADLQSSGPDPCRLEVLLITGLAR